VSAVHFRARQKRNFKLLRSFRQPLVFHFEVSAIGRTSFLATGFSTGIRREGGASYCLVSGRQPLRNFYFRGIDEQSNQRLRSGVFQPAPVAKAAHLTVSFLAVNPLESFCFRGVGDRLRQRLRSPSCDRRPLRRGRILLFAYRASTPVVKKIRRAFGPRKNWLFLRHTETVFPGRGVNLQELRAGVKKFFWLRKCSRRAARSTRFCNRDR
jgi:hypothetical protein